MQTDLATEPQRKGDNGRKKEAEMKALTTTLISVLAMALLAPVAGAATRPDDRGGLRGPGGVSQSELWMDPSIASAVSASSASSFYTPQQLEAMSSNWAAKGRLLGSPDAASFYTREQLQALSANWAAKGRLLGNELRIDPAISAAIQDARTGAVRPDDRAGRRELPLSAPEPTPVRVSDRFDWSDAGIGAGAVAGTGLFAILLAGLLLGRHDRRRLEHA